uniref:Uncharacterized protein n=1 Tax=Rhodopseudomonas palustris (strain BisA53) TaxID=316055 RepID=Q07IG6_RHOP5
MAPLYHVIAGLDPAIHLYEAMAIDRGCSFEMDARVKPAHDAEIVLALWRTGFDCQTARVITHLRHLATLPRPSCAEKLPPLKNEGRRRAAGREGSVSRFCRSPLRRATNSPRVALRRATGGDFGHQVRASGDRRDALRTTDPADFAAFTCPASSELTSRRASY